MFRFFFKCLETVPFQNILPKVLVYFLYIDDDLFIYHRKTILTDLANKLTIEFANDRETRFKNKRFFF